MTLTLGQYQTAWKLIPALSADDVAKALRCGRKPLSAVRQEELRKRLSVALHGYVAEKLLAEGKADVKRSGTARQLDRIANQAERLRKMMPNDGDNVTIAASQELRRELMLTPWLRRTLVLPPTDAAGFAVLQAMTQALTALAVAARRAYRRERVLIEREHKRKGRARHKGDAEMRTLFGTINGIWFDVFDEVPGVTPSETSDTGGGAYLPFVHTLLHAYAERVPDDLERLANLRARLRLTQQAIRAHFRATGISKLRRMA